MNNSNTMETDLTLTKAAIMVGVITLIVILFLLYNKWESRHATNIYEKRNKQSKNN